MKKHFWDLDLSQIPLAWAKTVEDAVVNCPKGIYCNIEDECDFKERFWYDPIGCKAKLETEFRRLQVTARKLYEDIQSLPNNFDELLSELTKIDIYLYSIIFVWCNDEIDFSVEYLDIVKIS